MALGLVGRTVRALSDHLNAYYRVFKGVDPDNVYVRLPTSGSFEIRHSSSNLPVLRVTDAGPNGSVSIPVGSITSTELADGTVDTADLKDGAVTSAKIFDGSIMNADVNAAAGIVVSKLAAGGTADRIAATNDGVTVGMVVPRSAALGSSAGTANTLLRSDGTNSGWNKVQPVDLSVTPAANTVLRGTGVSSWAFGAVQTADMVVNTINGDRIADASITSAKLTGASVPAGSITSAEIADGTIVNADVNAAAAIVVSKLAAGGTADRLVGTNDGVSVGLIVPRSAAIGGSAGTANTLLRSDGTNSGWNKVQPVDLSVTPAANTVLRGTGVSSWAFGQVQAADIGANVITNAQIAPGTIRTTELAAGAIHTIPTPVVIPGQSATNTTANTMTGTTIVITTQGGQVLVLVNLNSLFSASGTPTATIQLWEGGGSIQTLSTGEVNATQSTPRMMYFLFTPSGTPGAPVAHTYFLAWFTSAAIQLTTGGGLISAMEFKR